MSQQQYLDYKAQLRDVINKSGKFSGYDTYGRGFDLLISILARNTEYNAAYSAFVLNETDINSATLVSSIRNIANKKNLLVPTVYPASIILQMNFSNYAFNSNSGVVIPVGSYVTDGNNNTFYVTEQQTLTTQNSFQLVLHNVTATTATVTNVESFILPDFNVYPFGIKIKDSTGVVINNALNSIVNENGVSYIISNNSDSSYILNFSSQFTGTINYFIANNILTNNIKYTNSAIPLTIVNSDNSTTVYYFSAVSSSSGNDVITINDYRNFVKYAGGNGSVNTKESVNALCNSAFPNCKFDVVLDGVASNAQYSSITIYCSSCSGNDDLQPFVYQSTGFLNLVKVYIEQFVPFGIRVNVMPHLISTLQISTPLALTQDIRNTLITADTVVSFNAINCSSNINTINPAYINKIGSTLYNFSTIDVTTDAIASFKIYNLLVNGIDVSDVTFTVSDIAASKYKYLQLDGGKIKFVSSKGINFKVTSSAIVIITTLAAGIPTIYRDSNIVYNCTTFPITASGILSSFANQNNFGVIYNSNGNQNVVYADGVIK